jgi:chemotaxis protein CheC
MNRLDNCAKDALKETLNIGVGRAADSLSEMLGDDVRLEAPELEVLDRSSVIDSLRSRVSDQVAGIVQNSSGSVAGRALLLYPDDHALRLVRLLLQYETPLESITEMEREALVEVGNILNACSATFSDHLRSEIQTDIPRFCQADLDTLLVEGTDAADAWLVLRMGFSVDTHSIAGFLSFVLSGNTVALFRERLGSSLRASAF